MRGLTVYINMLAFKKLMDKILTYVEIWYVSDVQLKKPYYDTMLSHMHKLHNYVQSMYVVQIVNLNTYFLAYHHS